ncbi:MAG: hypothetical protein J7524_22515 [Roseofilum sp. Belize BBD 4]|uniref:hypothetical protein n=1 Tax=Roseofilum sp. Belize BBD 4 TaxID=2821500 RepID=UPI001B0B07DF|nr:hypothetical protein [Roseofilum sp. Belize BBD 4]MBP0035897.1 hypothetical protein [Roseofilum sp. Belize BBD 4]
MQNAKFKRVFQHLVNGSNSFVVQEGDRTCNAIELLGDGIWPEKVYHPTNLRMRLFRKRGCGSITAIVSKKFKKNKVSQANPSGIQPTKLIPLRD